MVIPFAGRRVRLLILGYGLLLFLWLGLEDHQTIPVVLLGSGMSVIGVGLLVLNNLGGKTLHRRYLMPGAALSGVMSGIGASVATAALMFFKNALHAHLFLDYPPLMMLAVLERAPIWGLAGGLASISLVFIWLAFQPIKQTSM